MDIDKGYEKIIENLQKLAKVELKVGIIDPAIAGYAMKNEFGDGVPERSFMRSTVRDKDGWWQAIEKACDLVLQGEDVRQAVGLVGEIAVNDIKLKISDNVPPPNAPSTIKKKGSSRTLIDSGAMRQSVTYEVNNV